MEAIKVKGIAKNGVLTIPVPDSFNEQELEVIVLSSSGKQDINQSLHEEKVKRLMSIVGTAKHPDLSTDFLDVYDQ
jgi:hypothetical protein